MKSIYLLMLILFLSGFTFSQQKGAQNNFRNFQNRNFTVSNITNIEGVIKKIDGYERGYEITIETKDKKIYNVMFGPTFYYEKLKINFKVNDKIKAKIFESNYSNNVVYYVMNFELNGKFYQVRDSSGRPLWAGEGYRNR